MERRVLLFLFLALAIILGYDYALKQMGFLPQPEKAPEPGPPAALRPTEPPRISPTGPPPSTVPTASSDSAAGGDERLVIETDLYRAVMSSRGATIQSWELKRYRVSDKEDAPLVQLVYGDGRFDRPLSLHLPNRELSQQINEGLYRVERDFTVLDDAHPVGHLTFRYEDMSKQIRVSKAVTFHYGRYVADVTVSSEGLDGPVELVLGTNFGIVEWGEGFIGLMGPASLVDDTLTKDVPETEQERKGRVRWVALQDKYFLSAFIPTEAQSITIKKEGDKLVSASVRLPSRQPSAVELYAGPKEYDRLRALQLRLEDTIDFGWFIYGSWDIVRAVAKPLFSILRFLYEYTHNYGVSIILLTVAIKLLFVPLQYKSYKSMKQMQALQPKVAAVQQKYKDDRERLNRELLKLYREHRVNPVGGCLPMVLQTPVFVALFNILYMTIDLRQAPFLLWITDLSAQDPYYVLPVLMGGSMVLQQKMTPTAMDPMQAKIMLVLPAFLTLLFLTFPAGLVLYWLTNNLLTIGQQVVTDRYVFPSSQPSAPVSGDTPFEDDHKTLPARKKEGTGRIADTERPSDR